MPSIFRRVKEPHVDYPAQMGLEGNIKHTLYKVVMKAYLYNIFYGVDLKLVPEKCIVGEVHIRKSCNSIKIYI